MKSLLLLLVAGATHLAPSLAKQPCPLYGPLFPKPSNLLQNAAIQAAAQSLDEILPKYIDHDNTTGADHFSYSVEVFSGSEDKPLWSKVDTNTVFRIRGITKIFTVLAFLATVGDKVWNEPVTKYLPELKRLAEKTPGGSMMVPNWEEVTLGSLASQTSGLIRDWDQLFAGLGKLPLSFPTSSTPAYADISFALLSYVAERITGKDFKTLVQDSVLTPLSLTHTFTSAPDDSLGIIPGNRYKTSWASTVTRRWLKPSVFTSDPKSLVGMPWGIRQLDIGFNQSFQITHAFNKLGSIGAYTSLLAIIPDLDIGFSLLAAGDPPAGLAMDIADTLTSTYLSTMTYVARTEADRIYSGQYRYTENITTITERKRLNSSLTISTSSSSPGHILKNWISNSTDMSLYAVAIGSNTTDEYLDKIKPSVRLYPTGFSEPLPDEKGKRVAFKAFLEDLSLPERKPGMQTGTDCATWVCVTGVVYASRPLDLFVFEVDETGKVRGLENGALRVRLDKVG
ncbi:beta-lactamase/transpeptidase-like protein [Pseudoneurospora amorphoporcata]|uniref:Beta-lactamase/transpeptidase-like protein n=1 Tax=Pseudoneurospora amorphoporcata TaxID=241081 RepID=A0AAN6SJN7_9PEZI|nr:beta-lactamase/transpeptidase-like protein [Pseudoneurospora amorphoporcata]